MICIDCGTEYEGSFCPKCGQPAKTKRITTKDTLHSIFVSFLMGDSKFMNTCVQLFVHPGVMVRNYLYGRRARLMAPVPMLVRLVAVYLLIMFLTGTTVGERHFVDDTIRSNMHSQSLIVFTDILGRILSNSVLYSLFSAAIFVVPFYLVFRRRIIAHHGGSEASLNMAEHFCVLVYISCQNMMLSLLTLPVHNVMWVSNLVNIIFLLLPVIMYKQLYQINFFSSLWRCLLSWILAVTMIAIAVILGFGLFYGFDAANV